MLYGSVQLTDHVKAGIAYAGFVSIQDKLTLEKSKIQQSVKLFNSIEENVQGQTYELINQFVDNSNPDDWEGNKFTGQEFEDLSKGIIKSVTDIVNTNMKNFEALSAKIEEGIGRQTPYTEPEW